jgi:hypothetical protein
VNATVSACCAEVTITYLLPGLTIELLLKLFDEMLNLRVGELYNLTLDIKILLH